MAGQRIVAGRRMACLLVEEAFGAEVPPGWRFTAKAYGPYDFRQQCRDEGHEKQASTPRSVDRVRCLAWQQPYYDEDGQGTSATGRS